METLDNSKVILNNPRVVKASKSYSVVKGGSLFGIKARLDDGKILFINCAKNFSLRDGILDAFRDAIKNSTSKKCDLGTVEVIKVSDTVYKVSESVLPIDFYLVNYLRRV